jgi:F420-dependent oxidoreductase-like protein
LRLVRFGLFVPQGWRLDLAGIDPGKQWGTMLGVARLAEDLGFESVWVYDHFHTVPVPTQEPTHEAWTLMAALGAATTRIRLGQMCTCIGYRNPMYLAKVAATVDAVSGGRAEMGIGAGWYEHEWNAYGYGFPTAGDRIAMLAEGVEIMRQAWTAGVATYAGEYYQVEGAICRPLPLQRGGIPLWIAGGGQKKTLRLAAKYAAYTNFDGELEAFRRKSQVLAEHCKDVGRPFEEITRSANYNVIIGSDEAEVEDRLRRLEERLRPLLDVDQLARAVQQYRSGPLIGTPERIVERLRSLRSAGLGYAIGYFQDAAYDSSSIRLFAEQVIPALA